MRHYSYLIMMDHRPIKEPDKQDHGKMESVIDENSDVMKSAVCIYNPLSYE
jgi:hypothetical protein